MSTDLKPRPVAVRSSWTAGGQHVPLTGGTADLLTRDVRVNGRVDRLTLREAELLGFLVGQAGRTIPRDELLAAVFGQRATSSSRAVDTTVSRLRAKIEPDPLAPVHVISVYGEGYRFVPPAPGRAALAPVRLGLPVDHTPLVGRGAEVADALAALAGGDRAVVLVGPGGVGKTRVARQVAANADAARVAYVSLASATAPGEVAASVAGALGICAAPGRLDDVQDEIGAELDRFAAGEGQFAGTLLVLDNIEQLDGIAPLVDGWLARAPELAVLATSRTEPGIAGERTQRIGCLPDEAATTLFLERATASGASIGLDDLDAIRVLVSRLDHLPLAIELAAARARALTPSQMCGRLDARLQFLAGSRRGGEPRQTSLRAALDWSWGLLDGADQRAIAALAVFPGSIAEDAADAVLGSVIGRSTLARLASASLVQREGATFHLLESVRAWALEKADQLGVRAEAELAHAVFHVAWLRRVAPYERPIDRTTVARIEPELPNLLPIPERMWQVAPSLACDAALMLFQTFQLLGPIDLYVPPVEAAVRAARLATERAGLSAGDGGLASLLRARGMALRMVRRLDDADRDLSEARALEQDDRRRAWLEGEHAVVVSDRGELDRAEAMLEAALPRTAPVHRSGALGNLGAVRMHRFVFDARTEEVLREAIALAARDGMERQEAASRANLGLMLVAVGRTDEAEVELEAAIATLRGLGGIRRLSSPLLALGAVRLARGDVEACDALGADAEAAARLSNNARALGIAIASRASLQLVLGDLDDGLRRLDEAEGIVGRVEDRGVLYFVEAYRATLLAASDRIRDAAAALLAARALADPRSEAQHLLQIVAGHLAWAEARRASASGDDPNPHLAAVARARTAPIVGTAARFLQGLLPEQGL